MQIVYVIRHYGQMVRRYFINFAWRFYAFDNARTLLGRARYQLSVKSYEIKTDVVVQASYKSGFAGKLV